MISNTLPHRLPETAPAVITELREAFDLRLTELQDRMVEILERDPPEAADHTVHVPFDHGSLRVVAVYHVPSEQFTQLIARHLEDAGTDRPSFTISLFL